MLSKMLIVLALMFSVYLATFETTTLVLFPAFLIVFGLVMEIWMEKKEEVADIQPQSWKTIGFWTLIALGGIFLTGFTINYSQFFSMSLVSAVSYTAVSAIGEEQFFRGFITDFMVSRVPNEILGVLASAGIFTMYHLARYGLNPDAMLYTLAGGFILSWVAWKSRRISPCMLAHLINNVVAVLGGI